MEVRTIFSGKSRGGQVQSGQIIRAAVRTKGAFSGSGLPYYYLGSCQTPQSDFKIALFAQFGFWEKLKSGKVFGSDPILLSHFFLLACVASRPLIYNFYCIFLKMSYNTLLNSENSCQTAQTHHCETAHTKPPPRNLPSRPTGVPQTLQNSSECSQSSRP